MSYCSKAQNTDSGVKWWQKESDCAEYELDIDIPLQIVGGNEGVDETEYEYSLEPEKAVTNQYLLEKNMNYLFDYFQQ